MDLIVLAGGAGTRLGSDVPKPLVRVGKRTLIDRVLSYWKYQEQFEIGRTIIVTSKEYGSDLWKEIADRGFILSMDVSMIQEEKPQGIAGAVMAAMPVMRRDEPFIVVLGDCLYRGYFSEPILFPGVAAWPFWRSKKELKTNFAVETDHNSITKMIESPSRSECSIGTEWLCGMGVYFLTTKIYDEIWKNTDKCFTELVGTYAGLNLIRFYGDYLNVNTPEDLAEAEKHFK